jgi:hypothetical protein
MLIFLIPFIIIAAIFMSLKPYGGICRKMDLIAKDIEKYGEPRQIVVYFDSTKRNTELDSFGNSSLDYVFWTTPKKEDHPDLYKNPHFYAEWIAYKTYRRFYLIGFIILAFFAVLFVLLALTS